MAKQKTESEVSGELKAMLSDGPMPKPEFVVDRTVDVKATGMIKGEVRMQTPAVEKLEAHEWGEKLGNFRKRDARLPQSEDFFTPAHAAADFLHGWSKHRHHFQGAPLLITQADYEAALEAAGGYPTTQPCEAALSPVSQVALERARAKSAEKQVN